ncbi:MAG: hypothetical protein KIH62_000640 [Candidatus Kerfeldbacteria bacterium]|nr:hypothetical protein [Candidatus Kerfeldbacteria bacterium]
MNKRVSSRAQSDVTIPDLIQIIEQWGKMEKRFEAIESRFTMLELIIGNRFDTVEELAQTMESHIDLLTIGVDGLAKKMEDMHDEERSIFGLYRQHEVRLLDHDKALALLHAMKNGKKS